MQTNSLTFSFQNAILKTVTSILFHQSNYELMNNKRSITIRDVAKRAGVSIATVSRYINKTVPVSKKVGNVIQQAMQETGFIPSSAARNLAKNRYETLGLLLTDMKGDFFSALVSEIEKDAREAGFDLLISISREKKTNSAPTIFPIGPQNTDGLIIFADSASDHDLKYLHFSGCPVVLISRSSPAEINLPSVGVENMRATKNIVQHLIEVHNRKRILFLRGLPAHEDSQLREAGYRQALKEHDIKNDSALITNGDFDRASSFNSIKKLIHKNVAFDGVFTGDDEAALGVLSALASEGIKVPEQVSVVGFDDQKIAPYLNPPLTTVHAPFEEVGRKAVKQLIRLINHQPIEPSIVIPSKVIIRKSCGC